MRNIVRNRSFIALITVLGVVALLAGGLVTQAAAAKSTNSGTTLAAVKTIDICSVDETTWRFSGEIAVWNQGAIDTVGLAITDCIQNKPGSGQFKDVYCTTTFDPVLHEVAAGTVQATADVYKYSIDAAPLAGDIRNIARVTILNHSSSIGKAFGPEPKATWTGGTPPPCNEEKGCVFTQGYWANKPGVEWPDGFSRDAAFFSSGQTWQQVMDTPVNVSQAYYQLAHQYIAAVLNQANGASVPSGVQDILNQAENWLTNNAPSACTANGSCGTQKDWAAILDDYNNGLYPGGPPHCGDE